MSDPLDPIRPKQIGDRNRLVADHAVMMAGVSEDETEIVFPRFDSNGRQLVAPAAAAANDSTTAWTPTQGYKTVAATGTPEAVGSGLVESVTLTAQKNRTTANTGNVWVGFSATNDSQLRLLAPGEQVTYVAPDGKKIDLAHVYIDVATNGDGVLFETAN